MPSHASAEGSNPLSRANIKHTEKSADVDWSTYATAYDLLSEHNPEYQALLRHFEDFITSIKPPQVIYEIGGGTGNYTQIAAQACPTSEIHFTEPDTGMIARAKSKLSDFSNIRYQTTTLEAIDAPAAADLVICVHALYTMPSPEKRLADLRRMMRPGAWLFLVDLGREMDVADWRRYLFSSVRKELGLIGALRVFWQGREIATQNTAIYKAQKDGIYWTHSQEELASALTAAGFEITRCQSVYRGYSDLFVCRALPV